MIVKRAEFVKSCASSADYADFTLPEIAVAGKSNVGKSSFINMLTNNGKLARVSKEAGHTRLINYFIINGGQFHLVDLPGYGYSAAAKHTTEVFSRRTEEYITSSRNLVHVLMLCDIRHEPSALDIDMVKYLYATGKPFSIIAVKSDKLSRAQINRQMQVLATGFGVGVHNIIAVSNRTGEGKPKLSELFSRILSAD